ncbi:Chloride channel protein [Sandaracinus amylolyticus]|uniref:Chloride channel protein n=2 Tax=Sandaracinus amylolyticus TaxID=927083 RepID=A0A0F6VYY5_9BACT|nr:chloride channel protein [Sandaracinus amylolyticus]AKF03015.1 Chloride channel protein [Sandaracinus amylolyticus]
MTFTIEEVVGTLDQTVLSGVVVAAALAAVVEHSMLGESPVLHAPLAAGLHHASSLPFYALLGVGAGLVAIVFGDLLLLERERAKRARVPAPLKPAIGGLLTGALVVVAMLAVSESGVAGGGYATLSRALAGALPLHALAILVVLKIAATVSSYSSGGAGGIFAPSLFVGAMLGGLVGSLDVLALGHVPSQELTSFALVGMGALFAGLIRAPITSVLIIFEMTHGYGLVLPLMISNSVAYLIARRFRPTPIYEALLAQDGIKLPHGATSRGSLASLVVSGAMTRDIVTIPAGTSARDAAQITARHGHGTYPVLDDDGRFVGLLSEARLQRSLAEKEDARPVRDIAKHRDYCVADETLLRAVTRMTRLGVRQLPVLERGTHRLVGMLAMSDVMRAQMRAEGEHGGASSSTDRLTLEALPPVPRRDHSASQT